MQGFGSEVLFHGGRRVPGFGLGRQVGPQRFGIGQNVQQTAQQYINNLKNSYTKQGNEYLLNTAQATTGVDLSGIDFTAFIAAMQNGDAAGAMLAFDNSLVAYMTYVGGAATTGVGIAWAAELLIMEGIMALEQVGATGPCTVSGCESTFNLSACDEFNEGNPFLWASIAESLPAVPPAQPFHFSGNPDIGPTNLLDWGSNDWQPHETGVLDPTKPGGPGSFEQALELAIMRLWDTQASPPAICQSILFAGQNGDIMLNSGLRGAIFSMLGVNAGAFIPIFVKAWNATHTTGIISTEVECTQALCQQAGGQWFGNGDCGAGGSTVYCHTTAPAPQRAVTYSSSLSGNYEDPLSIAFGALATISQLPSGGTGVVLINSGPLISSLSGQSGQQCSTSNDCAWGSLARTVSASHHRRPRCRSCSMDLP